MSFDGRFRKPLKTRCWPTGRPRKPLSKIRLAEKVAPNLGVVRFPKGKLRSAKRGPSRSKTHLLGPKGSSEAVSKNRNGFRDPQQIAKGRKRSILKPFGVPKRTSISHGKPPWIDQVGLGSSSGRRKMVLGALGPYCGVPP